MSCPLTRLKTKFWFFIHNAQARGILYVRWEYWSVYISRFQHTPLKQTNFIVGFVCRSVQRGRVNEARDKIYLKLYFNVGWNLTFKLFFFSKPISSSLITLTMNMPVHQSQHLYFLVYPCVISPLSTKLFLLFISIFLPISITLWPLVYTNTIPSTSSTGIYYFIVLSYFFWFLSFSEH